MSKDQTSSLLTSFEDDYSQAEAMARRLGVPEDFIPEVALAITSRNFWVRNMSKTRPFSPEWERASLNIAREDAVLAKFNLV